MISQKQLISDQDKAKLWKLGQRKTAFLVGFIERMHSELPNNTNVVSLDFKHPDLQFSGSEQGQVLLKTIAHILKKINQEYVLYRTLEVLNKRFGHALITNNSSIDKIIDQADSIAVTVKDEQQVLHARMLLAGVSERLVVSTISAHNLTGSAIRKKLAPVLTPIQEALAVLTTPQ